LQSGIPTDAGQVDAYIDKVAQIQAQLVQWDETFKPKFTYYEEAQPLFTRIKDALQLYHDLVSKTAAARTVQVLAHLSVFMQE
jgi:hypothetical protein